MSVQLDWEITDADPPLPDARSERDARQPGCRRWWPLFICAIVVAAVVSVFLWSRIRQRGREVENELRAIVELELGALIKGDRDLFLNQQNPDDWKWMRSAEQAFDRYHEQTNSARLSQAQPVPLFTGAITDIDVGNDGGWALVKMALGESAWGEIWFYRWTSADGWRHTWLDRDWLGEKRQHTTPHLRFSYLQRDETLVVALADEMEHWYDLLAPLLGAGSSDAPLLTVEFAFHDPRISPVPKTERDPEHSRTLLATSPHQTRLSATGGPGPELRRQMAEYLAQALLAYQAGLHLDETLPVEVSALRYELQDWAVTRLARTSPDTDQWVIPFTPLVDQLVASADVQIIPQLLARLRGFETLDQILEDVGLDPPDPATRFAFLLNAENRSLTRLDQADYQALADPEADQAWLKYRADLLRWRQESATRSDLWPASPPFRVRSVVFNDDVAWVEAAIGYDESTFRQVHFFRRIYYPGELSTGDDRRGVWRLTSPDPAYFGPHRTARTENLVLHYFQRDAEWYGGTIPQRLQVVFSQAAADLQVPTAGLVFTVAIELGPGLSGWQSGWVNRPLTEQHRFTSARISGWSTAGAVDQLFPIADSLVGALVYLKTGQVSPRGFSTRSSFIHTSISRWELQRLFPERDDWYWPPVKTRQVATVTLVDLWKEPTTTMEQSDWDRLFAAHRTLIEYLAETYGPEVIPKLLENLTHTDDLDQWLRVSTGHGLEQIEPAWQMWVLSTYGEE